MRCAGLGIGGGGASRHELRFIYAELVGVAGDGKRHSASRREETVDRLCEEKEARKTSARAEFSMSK